MAKEIDKRIIQDLLENGVDFVTSVPCKQLAGVIEVLDETPALKHVPCNKEDEGMGLCAGAFMGGMRPAIIMQNTALGVTLNSLATLIQFYQIPLPMLISAISGENWGKKSPVRWKWRCIPKRFSNAVAYSDLPLSSRPMM